MHDAIIIGGGPAGLQAALTLGRARRNVLLCDAGPRRNAAAVHVQNFVTRDGTPPDELRAIARAQLATYPNVAFSDAHVEAIAGARDGFQVRLASGTVQARRILLATGMVDEMLPIAGFREQWGKTIFQCPYCHGWEIRERSWGVLALPHGAAHIAMFALLVRAWTSDVTLFTNGAVELPGDVRERLTGAGLRIETAPIERITESAIVLDSGTVPIDALFTHPPQRQVDLVRDLALGLDEDGYVVVDPMRRETSVPGIYASGDLTTRQQAAVIAAASAMQAAAMINVDLATSS